MGDGTGQKRTRKRNCGKRCSVSQRNLGLGWTHEHEATDLWYGTTTVSMGLYCSTTSLRDKKFFLYCAFLVGSSLLLVPGWSQRGRRVRASKAWTVENDMTDRQTDRPLVREDAVKWTTPNSETHMSARNSFTSKYRG